MRRAALLLVLGLVACSEKPQTLGGAKQDAPAFSGTGKAYTEPGWKRLL